jgi:hypothetical protein
MRTKHCFLIGKAQCRTVMPIVLDVERAHITLPTAVYYTARDLLTFARRDGFENWDDMMAFWREHHPGVTIFTGVIIHWDSFTVSDHLHAMEFA